MSQNIDVDKTAKSEMNPVVRAVRDRYGSIARSVSEGRPQNCCTTDGKTSFINSCLYDGDQIASVPGQASLASLGCGNPTALAELAPGQVVLDLGSGGGIDVLLSAKRVAPGGKAIGLDMTEEMLALSRDNQRQAGVENAEFLLGQIEAVPLPDASVDVVISNCVINLSVDKPRVFAEALRVLRPGGLFAVSDIVTRGEVPAEIRQSLQAHLGCIAGALEETQCARLLDEAGFTDVSITPTRIYSAADARPLAAAAGLDPSLADRADGLFMSAFVRARKPAAPVNPRS